MRIVLTLLTGLAWALWLGGIMALVIFVVMLFGTDRPTALQAAPRMFVTFGKYQLTLAAVALIASCLWRLVVKSAWITALFMMFAIATLGAVALATRVVPRMEELRADGLTESAEYKRLHGVSSALYMSELAALVIAGAILPGAIMAQPAGVTRQTAPGVARATGSPAEVADRSTTT